MSSTKNQNVTRTAQASATTASLASTAANALPPPIVPIKYNEAIIDTIRSPINNKLTPIASGADVEKGVLVFEGRTTAYKQIIIFDNGVEIARVNATSSGKWVWSSDAFTAGEHHFTVQVVGSGNPVSTSYDISVPAQPEQPVEVLYAIDDTAGYSRYIASGESIADFTPRFSGKAAPNSLIKIFDGEREIGSVQTNGRGEWNFTATLDAGAHSLIFVAGKSSSEAFVVNIVTHESLPIEIITAFDDTARYEDKPLKSGDTTQDTTPRFSGKAGANVVVRLFDGEQEIGSTVSSSTGYWHLTPTLPTGSYNLVFKAGEGSASKPFVLTITSADAQPIEIITAFDDTARYEDKPLKSGDTTQDTTPRFSGRAGANVVVRLFDGEQEIGSTLSNGSGYWYLTPTLPIGSYNLVFKAGEGSASKPFALNIASADAQPIEIWAALEDSNGYNRDLAPGSTIKDTTPYFYGKAGANVVVRLYNGDKEIASTLADSSGRWSLTPTLTSGSYNLVFKAGEGSATKPFPVTIAAPEPVQPKAPEIEYILDNVGQGDYVKKNGTTDDDTPRLSGTAEPNSLVQIFDNDVKIGERRVSSTGYWDFTPVNPAYLQNGNHSLVVKSSNGTESEAWNIVVKVPVAVHFGGSNSGEETGFDETVDSTPFFIGYGPKGVLVRLYDGDKEIGSAVTSTQNGRWIINITDPLSVGAHALVAKVGNDNVSEQYDFVILAPEVPVEPENPFSITQAFDEFYNTGSIAANGATDDNQPSLSGKAPANTLVNVFDNGVAIGSALTDANGEWSFKPEIALSLGKHAFTIGNSNSNASDAFTFDVIAANVTAPLVLGGVSDFGGAENFGRDAYIFDNTPVFTGVAKAGSLVTITIDGKFAGNAIANEYGRWSFQTVEPVSAGEHEVAAFDTNGNSGVRLSFELADPQDINIGFNVYDDIAGEAIIGGQETTKDSTPLLRGIAGQDIVLEIYDNNVKIGSVRTAQDGTWSFKLDLANGYHSITVKSEYNDGPPARQFNVEADAEVATIDTVTGRYFDYDNSQPSGGEPIIDNRVVFYGSATPDATVQVVTTNGLSLGYTGSNLDGKWYLEVDHRFADGEYSVIAKVNGVDSEPFIFHIGERTGVQSQEDVFNLFDISGAELLSDAEDTLLGKEVEVAAPPVNLNLSQADLSVITTSGIATSTVAPVTLQDEQYQAI